MNTQVRTERLGSQSVYIIDGRVPATDVEEFHHFAQTLSFTPHERDSEDDEYPIMSVDFLPEVLENETLIGRTARELLREFLPDKEFQLSRSYINLSAYGNVEFPHLDCAPEAEDITILYYVNREWDYRWGGETLFYEGRDTRFGVLPQPGRFVIFPGNVEHNGTICTRICKQHRMSLALKYRRIEAESATPN